MAWSWLGTMPRHWYLSIRRIIDDHSAYIYDPDLYMHEPWIPLRLNRTLDHARCKKLIIFAQAIRTWREPLISQRGDRGVFCGSRDSLSLRTWSCIYIVWHSDWYGGIELKSRSVCRTSWLMFFNRRHHSASEPVTFRGIPEWLFDLYWFCLCHDEIR